MKDELPDFGASETASEDSQFEMLDRVSQTSSELRTADDDWEKISNASRTSVKTWSTVTSQSLQSEASAVTVMDKKVIKATSPVGAGELLKTYHGSSLGAYAFKEKPVKPPPAVKAASAASSSASSSSVKTAQKVKTPPPPVSVKAPPTRKTDYQIQLEKGFQPVYDKANKIIGMTLRDTTVAPGAGCPDARDAPSCDPTSPIAPPMAPPVQLPVKRKPSPALAEQATKPKAAKPPAPPETAPGGKYEALAIQPAIGKPPSPPLPGARCTYEIPSREEDPDAQHKPFWDRSTGSPLFVIKKAFVPVGDEEHSYMHETGVRLLQKKYGERIGQHNIYYGRPMLTYQPETHASLEHKRKICFNCANSWYACTWCYIVCCPQCKSAVGPKYGGYEGILHRLEDKQEFFLCECPRRPPIKEESRAKAESGEPIRLVPRNRSRSPIKRKTGYRDLDREKVDSYLDVSSGSWGSRSQQGRTYSRHPRTPSRSPPASRRRSSSVQLKERDDRTYDESQMKQRSASVNPSHIKSLLKRADGWSTGDRPEMPKSAEAQKSRYSSSATHQRLKKGEAIFERVPFGPGEYQDDLLGGKKVQNVKKLVQQSGFQKTDAQDEETVKTIYDMVKKENWSGGRRKEDAHEHSKNKHVGKSSLQLTVHLSNLGPVHPRTMYLEGRFKVTNWIRDQLLPLADFATSGLPHVFMYNEADQYKHPLVVQMLKEKGLEGIVCDAQMLRELSYPDMKANPPAVAVFMKAGPDSEVRVLDCYSGYSGETWQFIGAIFSVKFGTDTHRKNPMSRCGFEELRLGVFHINCDAARQIALTRKHFIHFVSLCFKHSVDIIGGDANRASYTAYKGQSMSHPDTENSVVALAMREALSVHNLRHEIHERISAQAVETESGDILVDPDKIHQQGVDTMVCWVLGWGKTPEAKLRRGQLADLTQRLRNLEKTKAHMLDNDEMIFLNMTDPKGTEANRYLAELSVTVSEQIKMISKQDLFLQDSGGNEGGGWHKPLMFNLRQYEIRNKRLGKKDKTIYGNYKKPLTITAWMALLQISNAISLAEEENALALSTSSVCVVGDEVNEDNSWKWILIVLGVSLILNAFALYGLCRYYYKKFHEDVQSTGVQADLTRIAGKFGDTIVVYKDSSVYHYHEKCQYMRTNDIRRPSSTARDVRACTWCLKYDMEL